MSYVVLHADRLLTVVADQPIVPAAEIAHLQAALDLLDEARRIRDTAAVAAEAAAEMARAEGHAAGLADGRRAAEADARAELFALAMRAAEDRRAQRAEITALAIEVIRHLAGEIGAPGFVAGLADRATATLVPDSVAKVRVHVDASAAVAARLAGRRGLTVEADASLAPDDCIVETALGRTHAGLDTQLGALAKAWEDRAHDD